MVRRRTGSEKGDDIHTVNRILCTGIAAIVCAWCGVAISSTSGPEGIKWSLIEIRGAAPAPLAGAPRPSLTLDAAQKKASGHSGCNEYFAAYQLDGRSLTFGPAGATRRSCPEPETGAEHAFLRVLERTRTWNIMKGELLLLDGDAVLARFATDKKDGAAVDTGEMTYRSTVFPSGTVTLSRGAFREQAAPDSASESIVQLTNTQAFGTLEGRESGAVVLVTSLGGTGSFYELALLSRGAKGWENTDTILLGDRVTVRSAAIENGQIVLAMTTHAPGDPSCCPTKDVLKRFAVQGTRLVPAAEGKRGGEQQIVGVVWEWVRTVYNNDTTTAPAKPERYTVRLLDNGSIDVKADCNHKGGTYSLEGNKLSIKITTSTMAACEEGSLEEQFVRSLSSGVSVIVKDGRLFIDLKYDTGTMSLSRQRK